MIEEQVGGADALLETWKKASVDEKPVDVFRYRISNVTTPKAIEVPNRPKQRLLDWQRQLPQLLCQRYVVGRSRMGSGEKRRSNVSSDRLR